MTLTRTSAFLIITTVLIASLSIPNLLDPNQGWLYIVEELVGFFLMILGYFVFRKNVEKAVYQLEERFKWEEQPLIRFWNEVLAICKYGFSTGFVILVGAYVFFYFYGEPEYFQLKVQQNLERGFTGHPDYHEPTTFSVFHFLEEIFGGTFLFFIGLFGVEEAFLFNENRQEKALKKERIEKERALSKVNALKNQLNPHFMFNTLNVLSGLVYEDVEKSESFIKKLSEVYRYVLEQSEEVVTSLEKEIKFIESYIYLQKIRFEDKLSVQFNINNNKKHWFVPTLTLELLVENAIKHNIIDIHQPLAIKIETAGNFLVVSNNLQLRKEPIQSTGIGLKNLQERLKLLDMPQAKFEATEEKFIAMIPLLKPD